MVTSIRIEAAADDPGQVRAYFAEVLNRAGLGPGDVLDEHYERMGGPNPRPVRMESGGHTPVEEPLGTGYQGRIKVAWNVPPTAAEETEWWNRTGTAASDTLLWLSGQPGVVNVLATYGPRESDPTMGRWQVVTILEDGSELRAVNPVLGAAASEVAFALTCSLPGSGSADGAQERA